MLETTATVIIVLGSVLLFAYWTRYISRLILVAKPPRDYAHAAAVVNRLSFPIAEEVLRLDSAPDLAALTALLDRDFDFLTYLLDHSGCSRSSDGRVLRVYYSVMRAWSLTARHFSPRAAHRAVGEMLSIVSHLASILGKELGDFPVPSGAGAQ